MIQIKKQIEIFLQSKFFKFSVIGVIGFVVDATTLYLFVYSIGFNLYTGRLFSYLCAATTTWIFNRHFTFTDYRDPKIIRQWIRFLIANSLGGGVNYSVYAIGVSMIDLVAYYPVLGVAAGSIAGLFVNFTCSSIFVFQSTRPKGFLKNRLLHIMPIGIPLVIFIMLFSQGLK